MKRRPAAHHKSVAQTAGGGVSSFEERVASLIGRSAISRVVAARVGDSDHPQSENKLLGMVKDLDCYVC